MVNKKFVPEKNSRQLPSTIDYCANKKYNDLMYGYLQSISLSNRDCYKDDRVVDKASINFTKMGSMLKISRQTASKYFKNMIAMGLIEENTEKKCYLLKKLPADCAYLIPKDTLQLLVDTLSEKCISTYVFLFGLYCSNDLKPYTVSLSAIKLFVGMSDENGHNNSIFTHIFFVLKKLGLLEYHIYTSAEGFENVKTQYIIDCVKHKVDMTESGG